MKQREPIPGVAALLPIDGDDEQGRAQLREDIEHGRVVPEVIDIRDRDGVRTGAVRILAVAVADHWHAGQPEPDWLTTLPRPYNEPPAPC